MITPLAFAVLCVPAPLTLTAASPLPAGSVLAAPHGGHFRHPVVAPKPNGGMTRGKATPGDGGAPPPTRPGSGTGPGSPPPGAGAPGAPGGTGPSTPGASGGASTGGDGGKDMLAWQVWWWFNRHRIIALRDQVFAVDAITGNEDFELGFGERFGPGDDRRPDPAKLKAVVAPAVLSALEARKTPEIATAAMVSLAKLGHAGHIEPERVVAALEPFIKDSSALVAETAIMSLGILASPLAIETLDALLNNTDKGFDLVGSKVPTRKRALAAVALGLVAESSSKTHVRGRVTLILAQLLCSNESFGQPDIPVAALASLGLAGLPDAGEGSPPSDVVKAAAKGDASLVASSRMAQLAFLQDFASPKRQGVKDLDGAPRHLVQDFLHDLLKARGGDEERVQAAAIQMLGLLADCDGDEADQDSRKTILRLSKDGTPLVRRLARIAAGRVAPRDGYGSKPGEGRKELQKSLVTGLSRAKSREKAWCALALGLLCHGDRLQDRTPDKNLVRALRAAGAKEKGPLDVGAYAIALGLAQDGQSQKFLLRKYSDTSEEDAGGQLALGLGLLGERSSSEILLADLEKAKYQPQRLLNSAIALGLLGERQAGPKLVDLVANAGNVTSQAAAAVALGWIGDGRAIAPLLEQLEGAARGDYAAAFALVALGRIGSARDLPWNATLAEDVPYMSVTATLVDGRGGVLDVF